MSGADDHEIRDVEEGQQEDSSDSQNNSKRSGFCSSNATLIAEMVGTYMLIFCGCGSVAVNYIYGSITFPGVCVVWGLIVMVMIYSVGHISGAHFNPAVSITFAIFRQFPIKQLPLYILAQFVGSLLASGTLYILLDVEDEDFFGTKPVGPHGRSFVIELITSFLLMFVISGVATDNRAIGELAGIAIGMTIMLNVFISGPVSGGSMNPVRSLGPAIVMHIYTGIWIYIIGPVIGAILGGFCYNLIRFTDKPLREISKSSTLINSFRS
uniref:NOD26-like intrinsic protein n=1 Tax=Hevea brasiliensis TaxID=3981 RepID=A0A2K8BNC6_HEVBR|nr:NOD26-like intrinsic protein [Hevea brasiliensis]